MEKALSTFPMDSDVQTYGCRAVTNLFNGEANTKQVSVGIGLIKKYTLS